MFADKNMENQKMKKIVIEVATIMLVILILAVNVQAETERYLVEYKNDPESSYN